MTDEEARDDADSVEEAEATGPIDDAEWDARCSALLADLMKLQGDALLRRPSPEGCNDPMIMPPFWVAYEAILALWGLGAEDEPGHEQRVIQRDLRAGRVARMHEVLVGSVQAQAVGMVKKAARDLVRFGGDAPKFAPLAATVLGGALAKLPGLREHDGLEALATAASDDARVAEVAAALMKHGAEKPHIALATIFAVARGEASDYESVRQASINLLRLEERARR